MAILANPEEKKLEQQTTQQQPAQQHATGAFWRHPGSVGNELNPNMSTPQQAQAKVNTPDPLRSMYDRTMETLRTSETSMPVFESDYDANIRELYNKITNREGFEYDYSTDPIYGQYKEAYIQQGRQAMRDTMGQTAALTGGYGNSYGSVAGQQTYDAYLGRLNDILPELEAQAYSRYQNEGDILRQQYALAMEQRNAEYGQFRDALGDFQYEQALDTEEAYNRAALGDWAKYQELYGPAAAKIAQIMSNPQAAFASGVATGEEIYAYTGAYPIGYTPPGNGGGGGISPVVSEYGGERQSRIDTVRNAMRDSSDPQAVVSAAVSSGLITGAEGVNVMKNWG